MLQQTQVATVIPYYDRWMTVFPTVHALAVADESDVLRAWEGLGYYKRVRMIHAAAGEMSRVGFPTTYEGWLEVPGVGAYTAAAISSIAFSEVQAVVDGNVKRVFARLAASDATGGELHKAAHVWATSHIDSNRPGDWNQSVMELGATICTPANPACAICPVQSGCLSFRTGTQDLYPAKVSKQPPLQLEESIVICRHEGAIGFDRTHPRGWWKGLSLLPNFDPPIGASEIGALKYTVTNHRITARVFLAECNARSDRFEWVQSDLMDKVAVPAPHRKALQLLTKLGR